LFFLYSISDSTMTFKSLTAFLTAVLFILISAVSKSLSSTLSCTELGFKETLVCSSCDELERFVPDEELSKDCRRCCAEEEEKAVEAPRFVRARLVVCQCKFGRYPTIAEFCKKESTQFRNLQIDYVQAADPVLHLTASNGNVEKVSINDWKTEHIVEFLNDKLEL